MNSPKTALVLLVLIASFFGPQSPAQAEDKTNKKLSEALLGKWQVTSRVRDGVPSDKEFVKNRVLVFEKDKYTVYDSGFESFTVNYKLDSSKKPALFDTTIPGESDQDAILKLEGDKLTICFGRLNGDRATEFKSPKGRDWILLEYKKLKK